MSVDLHICNHNRWYKCWMSLQDLTIASNRTSTRDYQFEMNDGGTLYVRNVIFDGDNYVENVNGPFWIFNDSGVNVLFEDCLFTNNDAMYQISGGSTVEFRNCSFESNYLTLGTSFSPQDGMFYIDGATVTFDGCSFENNK